MNTLYDINYTTIAPILVIVIWLSIVVIWARSWMQLRKAYQDAGMKWPMPSQDDINETFQVDMEKGYRIGFASMTETFKILFSMESKDATIAKFVKRIRLSFWAFILFPFLLAILIIAVKIFTLL